MSPSITPAGDITAEPVVLALDLGSTLGWAVRQPRGGITWCEGHGIPYQGVPVGTIKRFATGKGNAPKDAVIAAMRARGFAPADDNEADALALLLWAIDAESGAQKRPSAGTAPGHSAALEGRPNE